MGDETRCTARYRGQTSEGKALLETDELLFRGDFRLKVPLAGVSSAEAADGTLTIAWNGEEAAFELGARAGRWAERIRNPKTLLDKLGVKAGQRVSLVGVEDADFRALLEARGIPFADELRPGSDAVLFAAARVSDLDRLRSLREALAPRGAVWVVAPKGGPEPREAQVLAAGREAGLVDTKVVRWSDTHTAHRFVVPRDQRQ